MNTKKPAEELVNHLALVHSFRPLKGDYEKARVAIEKAYQAGLDDKVLAKLFARWMKE